MKASEVESLLPIRMLDRIPVALRDWMNRRGKDVVLLSATAGVTQEGSSKTCVTAAPRAKERTLYMIDHTILLFSKQTSPRGKNGE